MSKSSTTLAPWTEAHQREATPRNFEIMAELCRAKGFSGAHGMLMGCAVAGERESGWRKYLARAGLSPDRIEREVRRVRALAEGRLVRESEVLVGIQRVPAARGDLSKWAIPPDAAVTIEEAREWCKRRFSPENYRPVRLRVTRIRRAP